MWGRIWVVFVSPHRANAVQPALQSMPLNTITLGITSEWLTAIMEMQERLSSLLLPDGLLNVTVSFLTTLSYRPDIGDKITPLRNRRTGEFLFV